MANLAHVSWRRMFSQKPALTDHRRATSHAMWSARHESLKVGAA
jgi:hypothetical protein